MTMSATPTAAPAAPAAPATPAAAPAERPSLDQRAAAAKERLESSPSESVGEESSAPPPEKPSPADSDGEAKTTPVVDDAAAKASAERLARIEKVRAKEAASEQERQAKRQGKERDTEFEKLRARIAELEPMNEVFASEEALLAAAEAKGLTADKLIAWMRTRLTDPKAVAERQVKTEADKLREEMKALQARLDAAEQARVEERKTLEAQRAAETKTTTFIAEARAAATTHPRAAKLHSKFGDGGLIAFANQFIAPLLPEGYATSELHDHLEQLLEEIEAFGGSGPAREDTPAPGISHPPKKNGAAQPVTLSNGLTSERTSVTEETSLRHLPVDERVRLLKQKLEREPTP